MNVENLISDWVGYAFSINYIIAFPNKSRCSAVTNLASSMDRSEQEQVESADRHGTIRSVRIRPNAMAATAMLVTPIFRLEDSQHLLTPISE